MDQTTMTSSDAAERLRSVKHMIGNTPLLAIHYSLRGKQRVVYAKAERINMTGSIKDRMAFHILLNAYRKDLIRPGDTIVEATSGNTGISFPALGRALGDRVVIFMSTDLLRKEPAREDYIAPEIELLRYHAFGRVCQTCFDNDEDWPGYCQKLER